MLTKILKVPVMIKSWLIAGGMFIVGCVAALILGRRKQYKIDKNKVQENVTETLDRIAKVSKSALDDAAKRPDSGPNSSADKLRDDWSER
jgi:hypothetical protein